MVSDPDVFAALGLVGFTIAAPIYRSGNLIGVAAADITLDVLSEYLSKRKISPGSLSYVLDHQGRVIANSERSKTYTDVNGKVELQHITSVGGKLTTIAFGSHETQGEKLYTFEHADKQYVAGLSTLPPEFGKKWQLFVITPLEDFTQAFDQQNRMLLLFGLIAISLQLLVIYILSKVISSPLEQLATRVTWIRCSRACSSCPAMWLNAVTASPISPSPGCSTRADRSPAATRPNPRVNCRTGFVIFAANQISAVNDTSHSTVIVRVNGRSHTTRTGCGKGRSVSEATLSTMTTSAAMA